MPSSELPDVIEDNDRCGRGGGGQNIDRSGSGVRRPLVQVNQINNRFLSLAHSMRTITTAFSRPYEIGNVYLLICIVSISRVGLYIQIELSINNLTISDTESKRNNLRANKIQIKPYSLVNDPVNDVKWNKDDMLHRLNSPVLKTC